MMPGIQAGLILDGSFRADRLHTAFVQLLREAGFEATEHFVGDLERGLPDDLVPRLSACTLLLLVLPAQERPAWLLAGNLQDRFPHARLVVLVDKTAPWIAELSAAYRWVVPFEDAGLPEAMLSVLRIANDLRDVVTRDPAPFIPLARRSTEEREPYEVLWVRKKIVVAPDGHGYIETEHALRVKSGEFEGTYHYFGLNEYTPQELSLPSLADLARNPPENRFMKDSFSFRLLAPRDQGIRMGVLESPLESSDRTKVFRFVFSPRLAPGTILRFAWSWSHSQIFRPHGEDASTLRCFRDYGEVGLSCVFLCEPGEPIALFVDGGEPLLATSNPVGVHLASLEPRVRYSLHAVEYDWSLYRVQANTILAAHWVRG